MKNRIAVSIASDHLVVKLLVPKAGRGLSFGWAKMRDLLWGTTSVPYETRVSLIVPGTTQASELEALLGKSLTQLGLMAGLDLQHTALEAELGPRHAHVGLMQVPGVGGQKASKADTESYLNAWVTQTFHLDPLQHIVRHTVVGKQGAWLVTCTHRDTFAAIATVCRQHSLDFTRCVPAFAALLGDLAQAQLSDQGALQGHLDAVTLLERSQSTLNSSIGQFALLDAGIPRSIARMWVNTSAVERVQKEISWITQRLALSHGAGTVASSNTVYWPEGSVYSGKEQIE